MKKESEKTRSKQNFIRCSLNKIEDRSIMQLRDRPTEKSKRDKVEKHVPLFDTTSYQLAKEG